MFSCSTVINFGNTDITTSPSNPIHSYQFVFDVACMLDNRAGNAGFWPRSDEAELCFIIAYFADKRARVWFTGSHELRTFAGQRRHPTPIYKIENSISISY